ncbi:MAG: apolipoprotein N-acyltransferase [Spirochaetaceae bacterium]|jgi:apolipoprotein N-acyltransferase|nr:apolipoprotein N-acyltransferase [Spirochaetaceae bacterium]
MMNQNQKKKLWKIFLLVISLTVVSTEVLLSFFGPMATLDKTTVIIAPPYNSTNKDEFLIEKLTDIVESHFVKTGSFTIVRQIRFEDYFNKHPEEVKDVQPYEDYLKIAKEAGIKKMVTVSLYGSESNGYSIYLNLRDTEKDILMKSLSMDFISLEDLDLSSRIINTFSFSAKRISIFDLFFIILLSLQLIIIFTVIFNFKPLALIEISLLLNIVLFLFSYFFAKNANMDYFQKFVATKGQVTIAQDTSTEQFYAYIRFVPTFLLNMYLYLTIKLKKLKKSEGELYSQRYALFFTILSAILYSLSFPNQLTLKGLPVFAFFALVPLFLVLINTGFFRGFFYGCTFGILQAILINFWQGTYSYIGLQLVTIGLLFEYIIFMVILNLFVKFSGKWNLLIIPLVWCLFEYMRSIGYIGYPWGLIGTSLFSFTSFIQLASVTGIWGISLLLLYFNSALAWIIDSRIHKKNSIFPKIIFGLTVLNIIGGFIRIEWINRSENKAVRDRTVIVVQQNRDPRKHSYEQSLDFAIEVTDMALEELGYTPDLVLWPEGAFKPDIRWYMDESRKNHNNGKLVTRLVEYTKSINTYIATGTQDHIYLTEENKEIRRNFNSSALLNPDGSINEIYHKIKLVPFTEHFPYKKQLPRVWEFLQVFDTSNWLAGEKRKIMDANGLGIFTPICFEDAFPDFIRKFVLDGGDLIANISNDYWSLSPVEGMQHGINGLFRSVENRRPMVRSTCSGYTVYADSTGKIIDDVKEFYEKGYIIASIPERERPLTIYTRYGDWLPRLILILLILFLPLKSFFFFTTKWKRSDRL